MRRESFQGILLGIVIMCAVFAFITIAWATFNSTLTINGTATINKQSWKIQFTNTVDSTISSDTYLTGTKSGLAELPGSSDTDRFKISSTALQAGGKIGSFNAADDEIVYTWYIQNYGTFDANITHSDTDIIATTTKPSGGNINVTCAVATGDTWTAGAAADMTTVQAWCDNHVKATLSVDLYANASDPALVPNSSFTKAISKATTTDYLDVLVVKLAVKVVPSPGSGENPITSPANIDVTIPDLVLNANQATS